MCAKMTRERAEEFGAAWNSGNADLVTSFFADDGVYHASVGPDHLGKSYFGKENIRRGVQAFFDRRNSPAYSLNPLDLDLEKVLRRSETS